MQYANLKEREETSLAKKHWVRLTKLCNNHCVFCHDAESQDGTCIAVKDIGRDLTRGHNTGIDRLVLSGGEATLHPHFLDIVKLAKKMRYKHIQVITNGRMFAYKNFLNSAVNAGVNEITFSFHGHNEQLHDKQTQAAGSFRQSMAGLFNAISTPNLIVNIDIVINKINFRFLPDIILFFKKMGVFEFDLLQIVPFGRAWENKKDVLYDIEEAMPYLKKAFGLFCDHSLNIWTNRFPPAYLEGYEELIQHPIKLYDEISGRREIFEDWLRKGKSPYCYGRRCEYCFLKEFCKDLLELKSKGELCAKAIPRCLLNSEIIKKEYYKLTQIVDNKKIGIFGLLDFYINKRYFVKSLRCRLCKFEKSCSGAHIKYIRRNSFAAICPVKR